MPVAPSVLERLVLLEHNQGPGPFLDVLGAGNLRALDAALEHGIFAAVGAGDAAASRTAPELASELDLADAGRLLDLGGGHGLHAVECCRHYSDLLARARDAVAVGGTVAVLDHFEVDRSAAGYTPRTFVDFAHRVTRGGRVYEADTVREWLRDAGLRDVRRIPLHESRDASVIVAER